MKPFVELRRRNVIRVAGLYMVAAWLVVWVADTLLPVFEAPCRGRGAAAAAGARTGAAAAPGRHSIRLPACDGRPVTGMEARPITEATPRWRKSNLPR